MLLTAQHDSLAGLDPQHAIALVDQALARSAMFGTVAVPVGDVYDLLLDLRRAIGEVNELEARLLAAEIRTSSALPSQRTPFPAR